MYIGLYKTPNKVLSCLVLQIKLILLLLLEGAGGRLFEAGCLLTFSAFRVGAHSNKYSTVQYFSYWRLHWSFPWCRRFARSRSLPRGIAFDCGTLLEITACLPCEQRLHFRGLSGRGVLKVIFARHATACLDITENFHLRFINCNDWTIIFSPVKFSLTILCTIRQSVVTVTYACTLAPLRIYLRIYLVLISHVISKQPRVNPLRVSCCTKNCLIM